MVEKVRLIAFYLPQYHPIPENDEWWGKGFTEWTNVAKAKPLFRGHYQPHIPADLGFYDLRVPETRVAQAEMAQSNGIEAFCYWHYWFGGGKQLLERPFFEVLESGKPDFPFCLAWANQTWSGIWHGTPGRVLIEQKYPGEADYEAHFYALLKAFADKRYINVDGKPLFVIYKPACLPDPRSFSDCWKRLAIKEGLKGLYLAAMADKDWNPLKHGFDATIIDNLGCYFKTLSNFRPGWPNRCWRLLTGRSFKNLYRLWRNRPTIYDYSDFIKHALPELSAEFEQHPCVIPNWDNTPRSGLQGFVLRKTTPELYAQYLNAAIQQVAHRSKDHRLVFIKSWNEWAEGNHLEPDQRFGLAFLEATKRMVT